MTRNEVTPYAVAAAKGDWTFISMRHPLFHGWLLASAALDAIRWGLHTHTTSVEGTQANQT